VEREHAQDTVLGRGRRGGEGRIPVAADLALRPSDSDVIVVSNLFIYIMADLAAAIVGNVDIAASAHLKPERQSPSMFESVHGSAPA